MPDVGEALISHTQILHEGLATTKGNADKTAPIVSRVAKDGLPLIRPFRARIP